MSGGTVFARRFLAFAVIAGHVFHRTHISSDICFPHYSEHVMLIIQLTELTEKLLHFYRNSI